MNLVQDQRKGAIRNTTQVDREVLILIDLQLMEGCIKEAIRVSISKRMFAGNVRLATERTVIDGKRVDPGI